MMRATLLALSLTAGCASTTTPPAAAPAASAGPIATTGMTRVPLIVSGQGALLVDVTINGEAVVMILDTGAQSTVLDLATANRLGMRSNPSASYSIGVGAGRVAGRDGAATTFRLGNAFDATVAPRLQDFTNLTWNHLRRGGRPIVGLLGFDVLASYGAIVDVGRGEMWLRTPEPSGR